MASLAYSAKEVGDALGISDRHARRLGREGRLPAVELGGRIVFPKAAIHRWLEEHQIASDVRSRPSDASPAPSVVGEQGALDRRAS